MKIKTLYENPSLYEAECAVAMSDAEFWKNVIKKEKSSSVLEIGCGTGRVAEYIIDYIDWYGGIDISETFLEYFRQKDFFEDNKNKIKIYQEDIREITIEEKYDLVIFTSQFLGHIYTISDFIKIFEKVKNVLTSSGKVVIDYCNPDLRFLECHKKYQFCYQFMLETMIKVFERNYYNQNEQINYEERKYVFSNSHEILQNIPFRVYFPKELDALLLLNGYIIEDKYGDYDFSPFKEYCVKQIYFLSVLNE